MGLQRGATQAAWVWLRQGVTSLLQHDTVTLPAACKLLHVQDRHASGWACSTSQAARRSSIQRIPSLPIQGIGMRSLTTAPSPQSATPISSPAPTQSFTKTSQAQQTHDTLSKAAAADLLPIMSQPLPLGKTRNRGLQDVVLAMNGAWFLDPAKMLQSSMRALMVIKQVLADAGHVVISNSNPAFQPLMRHAAQHCTNSNIWWHWEPYQAGTLLQHPAAMMGTKAQPVQTLLAARGLHMSNPHCLKPPLEQQPRPRLDAVDRWRLFTKRAQGRDMLRGLVAAEARGSRLQLPGVGHQFALAPTLIVVLDLSHGTELVSDAHQASIMTASVVNSHSQLERITYPIYAAEGHPAYMHWFLNWLLKVANLPAPLGELKDLGMQVAKSEGGGQRPAKSEPAVGRK